MSLSGVTHQRLDQRRPEIGIHTTYQKGIRNIGDFKGCIRCMEVVHGGNHVWTAEHDGSISVRNGMSGAVQNTIERKKDIYVYCLYATHNYVWAGLSDGYLRVYNCENQDLVLEIKQHGGAVMCLIGSPGRVFSGSSDWQIYSWDARAPDGSSLEDVKYKKQFSGHQNSVRCLAVEGRYLFSGGDDCAIRRWDVDTGKEEEDDVWPLYGHSAAVSSLQVNEVYLFSASHDETVKVWNLQTGTLVKELVAHSGPVRCLMKDVAGGRMWSGGSDGIITVWDSLSLNEVARLRDHGGTYVTSMKMLCRVNAIKVWSVGVWNVGHTYNGIVRVWYSETETPDIKGNEPDPKEEELQGTISAMRSTIIQNYQELDKRKEQLKRMEGLDETRKRQLALAMGRNAQGAVKRHYYSKLMEWMARRRHKSKREELADLMSRNTDLGMLSVYFHKLYNHLSFGREAKQKGEISASLSRLIERHTASVYMKKLVEYVQLVQYKRKKRMIATALLRTTSTLFGVRYYNKWLRWLEMKKLMNKRKYVAEVISRHVDQNHMMLFYQKLISFATREREREKRILLADSLAGQNGRVVLAAAFRKLLKWAARRRQLKRRIQISELLCRSNTRPLLSRYFRRWRDCKEEAVSTQLRATVQDQSIKLAALRKVLEEQGDMSDEEVRRHLVGAQDRLHQLGGEMEELQMQNEKLRHLNHLLSTELQSTELNVPKDASVEEQLLATMNLLKAKAINLLADSKLISEVREKSKRVPALKMFLEAHNQVKRVVVDLTHDNQVPGVEWTLNREVIQHMATHHHRTVLNGVKEMVICYDLMPDTDKDEVETATEVVHNAHWLLEMVQVAMHHKAKRQRKKSPATHQVQARRAASPASSKGGARRSTSKTPT